MSNLLNSLPSLPALTSNDPLLSPPEASDFSFLQGSPSASPLSSIPLPGSAQEAQVIAGAQAAGVSGGIFGLSIGRVVAIILGFILIGGGLLLFRPVQEAATRAARTGAEAAA
jgi:hypothetical protein